MKDSKEERPIIYPVEFLISKKVPKTAPKNSLFYSLIKYLFESIGENDKGLEWAKDHDKDGLAWYSLFSITDEQYTIYKDNMIKIIMKQYGVGKTAAAREFSYFSLNYGWSLYKYGDNENYDIILCKLIKAYEEKNGELIYDDGYEKILKERIKFNNYINNDNNK